MNTPVSTLNGRSFGHKNGQENDVTMMAVDFHTKSYFSQSPLDGILLLWQISLHYILFPLYFIARLRIFMHLRAIQEREIKMENITV